MDMFPLPKSLLPQSSTDAEALSIELEPSVCELVQGADAASEDIVVEMAVACEGIEIAQGGDAAATTQVRHADEAIMVDDSDAQTLEYSRSSVDELRDLCRRHSLRVRGTKSELVARLVEALA